MDKEAASLRDMRFDTIYLLQCWMIGIGNDAEARYLIINIDVFKVIKQSAHKF
jgi:hypothetical protein